MSKIVGSTGEYFVTYMISRLGHIPALVRDGINTVNILATNITGTKTISLQVKTTSHAERTRGRGTNKILHHLEFPLGRKAADYNSENLYFVFVDLRLNLNENPDCYIIPSSVIFSFCESWKDSEKMIRFHPSIDFIEPFKNNWEFLDEILND